MNIFILDVNDNAPEFLQSTYLAKISSNATNSFPVIKLSAKDADEGENARITYKFVEVNFKFCKYLNFSKILIYPKIISHLKLIQSQVL